MGDKGMVHNGPSGEDAGKMKRTNLTSDKFAAQNNRGRRNGMNLEDTEHHARMKHELGSHPAYPGGGGTKGGGSE